MTNPETVTIYRDREGKIHEKPESAARSNLLKSLFEAKSKKLGLMATIVKDKPSPNDAIMEIFEVMMLEHWITRQLSELEGMIHEYITDCKK